MNDALTTLVHLFVGGTALGCPDAADADDNGVLEIADAITTLRYLFVDATEPLPPPHGVKGPDPTPDQLDCPHPDGVVSAEP